MSHIPAGYNAMVRDEILVKTFRDDKEEDSMKYITRLIIASSSYVLLSLVMEITFFIFYNGWLHPFSKILDQSAGMFLSNY